MKLSAPTQLFFVISLVLIILALVGHFRPIATISENQFWIAIVGYAILAFGCLFRRA